jgi:hypothetical protein
MEKSSGLAYAQLRCPALYHDYSFAAAVAIAASFNIVQFQLSKSIQDKILLQNFKMKKQPTS